VFSFALWQPVQFFERNGRTRESKVCRFCPAPLWIHDKKMQPNRTRDGPRIRIKA